MTPYVANDTVKWAAAAIPNWERRQDQGIFIHIVGDDLWDGHAWMFYGLPLVNLDGETRARNLLYWTGNKNGRPILLISAASLDILAESLRSNPGLRELVYSMLSR